MKKALLSIMALLLCAFGVLCLFSCDEETIEQPRQPATVTIYSTNDIHGVVAEIPDNGVIGLPIVAGIAASTDNSILLDAGDATQGLSFATVDSGAHVIDVMNAAGYDAMAAGNHDFDYGSQALLDNAQKAEFPILSANALKDGQPLLTGSTVIEAGGYKIGIIGLTTASTATSTNPAKLEGITFEDEIAGAQKEIAGISDSVDAIVLLAHLGDNPLATKTTSEQLLAGLSQDELAKVAAVVDGHSHTVEQKSVGSAVIVQTGTQNTGLGVVTIAFDGNGGFETYCEVWDYAKASGFELTPDGQAAKQAVQDAYDGCLNDMQAVLSRQVAQSGAPIWGGYIYYDYAEPRIVETTMGDLVTDAFKYYGQLFADNNSLDIPVIGVENGGGISATLPMGTITRGDILNAFNHGNTVDAVKVNPSQLYTALEPGLTMTGQEDTGRLVSAKPSGSFLQVSGITYSYDPSAETGNKVVSVTLDDGTPLEKGDTETQLLVVTNNYVSTFEGLKAGEKLGELGGEDAIVMDYILLLSDNGNTQVTLDKPAGRILIENDKSPETYDVVIPIKTPDGSEYDFAGQQFEISIDHGEAQQVACESDGIHLTVAKGAHTYYLTQSADNIPVYTNNYSGSGTVTTKDGYYHLYFTVDQSKLA